MGANILIVEDEEPLTTLLRYNLEAEGYEVDAVTRGDDADTRLKETAPDLVVLDWMLPGLSGLELCRRLRARRGKRARARARHRRRRLYRQAVLGAGTPGAGARAIAPRQPRARRHDPQYRRPRARPREEARVALQPARGSRADRIPPARISDGTPRPGVFARAIARRRLGQRRLYRRAHRRRACRPPAQGAQPRPRRRSDPHRARCRLFAGRSVRQGELIEDQLVPAKAGTS